ncbi:TetR/AcrR family transcriptional regulator C-terminal domain-containing protein [Kitasatospora sp. NPDC096077]|uniref:TetR/AcrR family transcriptional regulator C-terminal domain-containing protein n=1 Tax=Kitasatospora sp. NPDC096077 TaxID=3155544 RepID=UPI00332A54B4
MAKQSVTSDQLNATTIARAAIAMIDAGGPEALNFRALGDRLGVSHTTVHRRCGESVTGLLDMCMDYLAGQLPEPQADATWPELAEQSFTALYELLAAHPGLVALRGARPWMGRQLLARLTEPVLAAGERAGMTPTNSVTAYRRLYLFTLGCAAFVNHADAAATRETTRQGLAVLPPDQFPFLAGHLESVLDVVTGHGVFHSGLRQLIGTVALDLVPLR